MPGSFKVKVTKIKPEKMLCKKIRYSTENSIYSTPTIIFGIIVFEDKFFYKIKTMHKEHIIAKSSIISIEDTQKEFLKSEDT